MGIKRGKYMCTCGCETIVPHKYLPNNSNISGLLTSVCCLPESPTTGPSCFEEYHIVAVRAVHCPPHGKTGGWSWSGWLSRFPTLCRVHVTRHPVVVVLSQMVPTTERWPTRDGILDRPESLAATSFPSRICVCETKKKSERGKPNEERVARDEYDNRVSEYVST